MKRVVISAMEMVAILAKYAVKVHLSTGSKFQQSDQSTFHLQKLQYFLGYKDIKHKKWQLGAKRGYEVAVCHRANCLALTLLRRRASEQDEGRIISRYELDHRRRRRRDQNSIIEFLSWALRGGKKGRGGGRSSPMS